MKLEPKVSSAIETAISLLRSIDTPVSHEVVAKLLLNDFQGVLDMKVDPNNYTDSFSFQKDYQAVKLLSKSQFLPTGIDKKAVAKDRFAKAEKLCSETNNLLELFESGTVSSLVPDAHRILHSAQRKISNVLGCDLESWQDFCGFGPGADNSTSHGRTAAYNKLATSGSVTLRASKWLDKVAGTSRVCLHTGPCSYPRSLQHPFKYVTLAEGNVVAYVPKNSKTDRSISIEPRWNVYLQKGLGSYLRKRLKLFGVNLDDQTVNQNLALTSSETGLFATIDLASASDTLARSLVWHLLPYDWAVLFDDLRSHKYQTPEGFETYEKFSSMGNGFTFELESLIFWAISSSISDEVSVYGDDIIVKSEDSAKVIAMLQFVGFETNVDKTFVSGPFRESCGYDAWKGVMVTPIYFKECLDEKGTLRLVNQVTVLARRFSDGHNRDRRFRRVWYNLVHRLPSHFRVAGPSTISTCIHSPSGEWTKRSKWGWSGWFLNVALVTPLKYRYDDYDSAVTSVLMQPSSDGYTVRDKTRLKIGTVFVPSGFEDIGDWV